MRREILCFAATALLGLASCSATSGSVGTGSRGMLAGHDATMSALGFRPVGAPRSGQLTSGDTKRHRVRLAAGECYRFVALGESRNMDLEVSLVTARGQRSAASETSGPEASVRFCPASDGDFVAVVSARAGAGSYLLGVWLDHSSPAASAGASEVQHGTCASPNVLEFAHPVEGSTANGRDNASGTCLRAHGPDVIYSLTVPARRRVTIVVHTDFDAALYLQRECGSVAAEVSCCNLALSRGVSRIDTVLDAGRYFVVVDSVETSTHGRFTLSAEMGEAPELAQVCARLPEITSGVPYRGDTTGHPDLMRGSCTEGQFPGGDLAHSLRLTQPSRVRATVTADGEWDPGLYIRRSCAAEATEIACNDDAEDQQHARITRTLDAGDYTLVVDGFVAGSQGPYGLDVSVVPTTGSGIANDACANAQPIELDSTTTGDTFAARDDLAGSCGGGNGAPDAAYRIRVTRRTHFKAELERIGLGETPGASRVYLTRNCASPRGEVACATGSVDAVLAPGTWYLVVDGASRDDFGRFVLRTSATDPAAVDAACRRPAALDPGVPVSGTTSGPDRFHASCGSHARSPEQVYSLRLATRRHVTVDVHAQYDSVVSLRSTCDRDSSEIACNDDASSQRTSHVEADLDPGTYYVVVDGFDEGNSGAFTVQATLSEPGTRAPAATE